MAYKDFYNEFNDVAAVVKGHSQNPPQPGAVAYAVVRNQQGSKNFTIWHATLKDARREAERLARTTAQHFVVVKIVGHAVPADRPVEWREIG